MNNKIIAFYKLFEDLEIKIKNNGQDNHDSNIKNIEDFVYSLLSTLKENLPPIENLKALKNKIIFLMNPKYKTHEFVPNILYTLAYNIICAILLKPEYQANKEYIDFANDIRFDLANIKDLESNEANQKILQIYIDSLYNLGRNID